MSKISLPKYQITSVPSGGIAYPENWKIEITPYTFGQSSGIQEADFTKRRFYNLVLEGVNTNFDKSLLTIEDVIFISVARKLISSKSNKVTLTSTCPECFVKNKLIMGLQEAVKFEKSKISSRDKYPVKVRFSKYIGYYRHLTFMESVELLNEPQNSGIPSIIKSLVKRTVKLVEIVGEEEQEKLIYDEYKTKDKATLELLQNIYSSFIDDDEKIVNNLIEIFESMNIESIEVECQNKDCKAKYKQNISEGGLTEFLTPFRDESSDKTKTAIDV